MKTFAFAWVPFGCLFGIAEGGSLWLRGGETSTKPLASNWAATRVGSGVYDSRMCTPKGSGRRTMVAVVSALSLFWSGRILFLVLGCKSLRCRSSGRPEGWRKEELRVTMTNFSVQSDAATYGPREYDDLLECEL